MNYRPQITLEVDGRYIPEAYVSSVCRAIVAIEAAEIRLVKLVNRVDSDSFRSLDPFDR
jgi:hypothetical protein